MTAYGGFVVPERDARRHVRARLDWLSDGVVIASRLGTMETTAIVHPRAFTAPHAAYSPTEPKALAIAFRRVVMVGGSLT